MTTDYVLDETCTLLRQRVGRVPIARFSDRLRGSPSLRRVRIADAVFEESLRLMLSRADPSWSFADGTGFVTMREIPIPRAFTWDRNFAEAGFEIVPGD